MNHGSIFVSSYILSMEYPSSSACAMANMRRSVGLASSSSRFSNFVWSLPTKPCMPCPIILSPFCISSSKVRPIDIISPTDFMLEPILRLTPANLVRSHLGILQMR